MKKISWFFVAVLMLSLVLSVSSCGQVGDLQEVFEDDGEPYEIVYYMVYNDANPPQDITTVENALNKILKKEINSTIDIYAYTLAEYTSKVSGAIAATVKFDVCFTSPEINPYITNVQREAFLPLDYLLPTYAPETWAGIDQNMWDQARVNGKIYGSINEQIYPRSFGLDFRTSLHIGDYLNEFYPGTKTDNVYQVLEEQGKSAFEFVTEYLTWMKETNRGAGGRISGLDTESTLQNLYGFDNLCTGISTPGVVNINDDAYTVVNQFETEEYEEMIDQVYEWKEAGFLKSGSAYDITPESNWKPGYRQDTCVKLSDPHYFTSYIIGTMNAISSTSENPARAMKFIELMRTNPEVHNLLQFGVEDVHYIKDPENSNRILQYVDGSGYNNAQFGWGLGSEFISLLQPRQPDDVWEQVKQINAETPMTGLIGFNFDATSVKQKIADCRAVTNEYMSALASAEFVDKDAKLEEFRQRLKAAGADEIIAEKQRQLNEYLASKQK